MLKRRALAIGLITTLLCLPIFAQDQSDKDLLERIRKEEATNSQIMRTMHMLADVYGPRLTGSPNRPPAPPAEPGPPGQTKPKAKSSRKRQRPEKRN